MNIEDLLNVTPGLFHPVEIDLLRAGDEVLIQPDRLLNLVNAAVSAQADADRVVWAMDHIGNREAASRFLAHVLQRGGTGDLSDCRTFIDAAMQGDVSVNTSPTPENANASPLKAENAN
jgi:hypothetical protein